MREQEREVQVLCLNVLSSYAGGSASSGLCTRQFKKKKKYTLHYKAGFDIDCM
jgi:hypothetical protein